jgi:hypothetical protein
VVAYDGFIKCSKPDSPERKAALAAARREFNLPEATAQVNGRVISLP